MGEITEALRRAQREEARAREGTHPERAETADPAAAHPAERDFNVPDLADKPDGTLTAEARAWPDRGSEVFALSREEEGSWPARTVLIEARRGIAERYRQFALRVRPALERLGTRSVLVTSGLHQEGKTTTSCNLALALASITAEGHVAIVDLDLHRPSVGTSLGIESHIGIESVLARNATLEEARVQTDLPSFDVYPAARSQAQAHELLSGPVLASVVGRLERMYDFVVIDTPPTLLVPDVAMIAPTVGAVIAVARSSVTTRSTFREMMELVPREKLIGTFLNDHKLTRRTRKYVDYYRYDDSDLVNSEAAEDDENVTTSPREDAT